MLTLPIKKKWFYMILSGEKTEEYREFKPYYTTRFKKVFFDKTGEPYPTAKIRFRNGYRIDSPSFVANTELSIGKGNPAWGAPPKECYILHINEVLREAD